MKTKSICIIEVSDGQLLGVTTFSCSAQGCKAARRLFTEMAREHKIDLPVGQDSDDARGFQPSTISEGWNAGRLWDGDGWSLHVQASNH